MMSSHRYRNGGLHGQTISIIPESKMRLKIGITVICSSVDGKQATSNNGPISQKIDGLNKKTITIANKFILKSRLNNGVRGGRIHFT